MNKTRRHLGAPLLLLLLSATQLAACGSRSGGVTPSEVGLIRASLMTDVADGTFASVRIDVEQGATIVATDTVPVTPFSLPDAGPVTGGDAFFTLKPGGYGVIATALDDAGRPVLDCSVATATATVVTGQTTEIVLGILCGNGGTGGLDVVVTVSGPPVIKDLQIVPGKFIQVGQLVNLRVVAAAARLSLPLTYGWSVISQPNGSQFELNQFGDVANFQALTAGEYTLGVSVTDVRGRIARLTFPLHVRDGPTRPRLLSRGCRDGSESLESYAARCDKAMGGVSVPAFDCDDLAATEPPRQSDGPAGTCGAPNVLNSQCDPGSHFHMLHRNDNGDGIYIAAHCRKKSNGASQYGDVAVIQYNSNTGATCFYQALQSGLPHLAPAPRTGQGGFWLSAQQTASINCVQCHDSGPFIRSPYLAQLGEVWPFWGDQNNPNNPARPNLPAADKNYLPGTLKTDLTGPWNATQPYMFVGLDFQSWEAYSLSNASDPTCTGCHRMGTSRTGGFWNGGGTSKDFGIRATNTSQSEKVPHGALNPGVSSPIWMTPGQLSFTPSTFNHANAMKACADGIASGAPPDGCTAMRLASGDTCPPPPTEINGGTVASDPHSWKNSGKMPLGQPGGRIGFYYFTSVHGPFYQNTPWDPYMNAAPPVASPAWDPPTKAPGFRGTYLRIYSEPPGQWMVAWGLDATDLQNNNNTPPPPGGPGGVVEGLAFDQIDSVPDPGNCGSGFRAITDTTGNGSPLSTTVDSPQGTSVAILAGFIGNVARGTAPVTTNLNSAVLGIHDDGGKTVLSQTHLNNPTPAVNQWFTAEAWSNGCANWQVSPHYAAHTVRSNGDVLLVPIADVPNVICYIDGLQGDWAQWRSDGNGGSVQPYAQIYVDPATGYRLKVWPGGREDAVAATASCVYLKN